MKGTSSWKMGKKLYAVANRTHEKAVDFAKKYGVEKVYDKIEDMFYDDETDIIYITTPHNTHIKFMIEALKMETCVMWKINYIK